MPPLQPDNYPKIKELYYAALELTPEKRELLLAEECPDDEIRAEVESLFSASESAGDFLNDVSAAETLQNLIGSSDKLVGQKIGPYKIEKEIGRGGMGVVFLVSRDDFHQRAAIKLIKRGMDSDAILERFTREREILAALEHPYIARLTDGGTTEAGLPFFVLEYIQGLPVDEYCRKGRLAEKNILDLFRKMCEAVSFAHQKLVVHRDLKPTNILVTEDGTPKLLDFGIAKILNSTDGNDTLTSQRALTPAYASPEQIRGERIDTTSDVYSLGKILSELIEGVVPGPEYLGHDTAPGNIQTTAKRAKPASRDLYAIIQTALHEDASRRYSSVQNFSDDIRRYQKGLPVTAREDTFIYRARKFARRNYVPISVAALFLILCTAAFTVIIREHNKAERRFNDVRTLANSFLFEFNDSIQNLPGSSPARKLVVQRALEYLNKLDQESSGDPSLQRELATAYEKVGKIQGNSYYSNLGDTDGAMKSYQYSLDLRQNLSVADPDNIPLREELSDSYEGMGDMLYTVNRLEAGLGSYQQSLTLREKNAASLPDEPDFQSALGSIYSKIGDIEGMEGYPNLGNTAAALENYVKAVAVDGKLAADHPAEPEFKLNYADKLSRLGILYRITGKTRDSISVGRKAEVIFQQLVEADPNNISSKFSMLVNNAILRQSLVDDEQFDNAVALMERTISTLKELQAADPKNMRVTRSLGVSYNALSQTLTQKGDFARAIENSTLALEIAETAVQRDPGSAENTEDLASTLRYLAEAELGKRDLTPATINFSRALEIHEKDLSADPSNSRTRNNIALCHAGIGKTEAAKGDFDMAIKDLNVAIDSIEASVKASPVNISEKDMLAIAYSELAEVYVNFLQKRGDERGADQTEAKRLLQKSADIWSAMQQDDSLNAVAAHRFEAVSALLQKNLGTSQPFIAR